MRILGMTVAALLMASSLSHRASPMEKEKKDESLKTKKVLETFIRLRDGVAPSSNANQNRVFLINYEQSFSRVQNANIVIGSRGGNGCRRFTEVHTQVGRQLQYYFRRYLDETDLKLKDMILARLKILQFFERALFGMVLARSEGGQSGIDDGLRYACGGAAERSTWTNLLMRNHLDLDALSLNVLGEPGSVSLVDGSEGLRQINQEYGITRTAQRVAWVLGEIGASILLWQKAVSPCMRALMGASPATLGRTKKFLINTAYVLTWVTFDRAMRDVLPFLKDDPKILDTNTVSSWDWVLDLSEEFLLADLMSPPLYFAYIEVLSLWRKETFLQFMNDHSEFLEEIEREHGSIEEALKKLKEVLPYENGDSKINMRRSFFGEFSRVVGA